jgi:hypothetical protein
MGMKDALHRAQLQKQQKQPLLQPMLWKGMLLVAKGQCALCRDPGARAGARGASMQEAVPGCLVEMVLLLARRHSGMRGPPAACSRRDILKA